jgi:FtsZ-interacting cell division protein YlmF
MRTVGRPAKASALKGQAWAEILDTELLGLLQDGLGVYFDRWQEDLNSKTLEKVEKDLKDWFGGNLDSVVERNLLKKLNNSASAPGAAGFDRTLQALNEIPKFKELSSVKSSVTFEKFYSRLRGLERDVHPEFVTLDKSYRCDGCENIMHEGDTSLQAMKRMGAKQGQHYWHVRCWFADEVRKTVGDFRKLRGTLDKQSKAARAILAVAPKNKSAEGKPASGKMLQTEKDYENWLSGIWKTWCESTKVKSAFHKAYYREFHEYSDLVLLSHFRGNVANTSFYEKFIKHVSSADIENKFLKGLAAAESTVKKHVISIDAIKFSDCRTIGESFRSNNPLLVDLSNAPEDERKRIIDFMAGMTFALNGTIERVSSGVFMVLPHGVEVESEIANNATEADLLNFFNSSKFPGSKDIAI